MTAYVSQQNGNWSLTSDNAASPWYDNGTQTALAAAPGDGDSVTISHEVTVDANTTIGTSPANDTTYGVDLTSGAHLIIGTDITLTAKTSVRVGDTAASSFTMNAGSSLIFDGSGATNQIYTLRGLYFPIINVNGTSANRCFIGGISTDARGYIYVYILSGTTPLVDISYCDFQYLGDSNADGDAAKFYSSSSQPLTIEHCTFDDLTSLHVYQNEADQAMTVNDVVVTNATHVTLMQATTGTGARTITDLVCEADLDHTAYGAVYTRCFARYVFTASGNYGETWNDCCVVGYLSTMRSGASINDSIITGGFLPLIGTGRYVRLTYADTEDVTIDGCVLSPITGDSAGDAIAAAAGQSGNFSTVVDNCLYLPNERNQRGGKLTSSLGDASTFFKVRHNTIYTSSTGETGIGVGETYDGHAGLIADLRSNLFWTHADETPGIKVSRQHATTVQDIVDPAFADYNWGWNLATGNHGRGYHSSNWSNDMFAVTPVSSPATDNAADAGVDDNGGNGDPQFVDSTRSVAAYDIDGLSNAAGTAWADATAYTVGDVVSAQTTGRYFDKTINFRCIQAHTSDALSTSLGKPGAIAEWQNHWEWQTLYRLREDTSRIAACVTWVKNGFKVQNASLNNAGHDGVTIGAVAYIDTATYNYSLIGSNLVRS